MLTLQLEIFMHNDSTPHFTEKGRSSKQNYLLDQTTKKVNKSDLNLANKQHTETDERQLK